METTRRNSMSFDGKIEIAVYSVGSYSEIQEGAWAN
jgi:hypothetical protein